MVLKAISQSGCILQSHQQYLRDQFLHICGNIWCYLHFCLPFWQMCSLVVWIISLVVWMYISLLSNNAEHFPCGYLFHVHYCHLHVFSSEISPPSSAHFQIRFLTFNFWVRVFWTQVLLLSMWSANILSQSVICLPFFLTGSFSQQMFFNFDEVNLSTSPFIIDAPGIKSRSTLPGP